jgi:FtsZ-binding cell division protein ZapB
MSVQVDASVMPNLDAFDEEFGHDESEEAASAPRLKSGFRLSTMIALALAAGVISALAMAWPNIPGLSDPSYEKPQAAIERLTRELETLRQQNAELAQAQQEAAETIATLQVAQQEQRAPFTTWYSELAALTYATPSQPESTTNGHRSASARPRPREVPKRDDGGPISLEPSQ